jgi:LysR family nod box-dependent transcriptional activator
MNLSQVDLNLLVALDALLTEKNVTRAGERVGLSQPAMSSALARLRRLFQDELLVREGREYRLTFLAQELVGPLREILHLIDETIEKRPGFNPACDQRVFTIVASDHMSFLVLQPLFERLVETAPGVKLQIQPLVPPMSPDMTTTDILITYEHLMANLQSQVLFRDRWVCAVWAGNDQVGDQLSLEQYLALPHLGYGASIDDLTGLADRAATSLYPTRQVKVSVETFFLLPFLLQGTRMVAFVHERLGKRMASISHIRLVEPPFEVPIMGEAMFWHPRSNADPAHRWLREQIAAASAAI